MMFLNFNPIQMGADFTSFHISEIENEVRDMVDSLLFRYGHEEFSIDILKNEMASRQIDYDELPQSCRDMIDELEVC